MRLSAPYTVIISGSGTRVGKTFLAVTLIRTFSRSHPLLALKISPHVHDSLGESRLLHDGGAFRLFEDLRPHRKNSGQYLAAGARRSFFMETGDEALPRAFSVFLNGFNPDNLPVVCESGALARYIRPGLFFFLSEPPETISPEKKKLAATADLILPARVFPAEAIAAQVRLTGTGWSMVSEKRS